MSQQQRSLAIYKLSICKSLASVGSEGSCSSASKLCLTLAASLFAFAQSPRSASPAVNQLENSDNSVTTTAIGMFTEHS